MEKKCYGLLLLLLLVLVSQEMVVPAEARVCLSQSHKYKGTCLRGNNCANVCKTEGFPGGDCRGLRRRCFCSKPYSAGDAGCDMEKKCYGLLLLLLLVLASQEMVVPAEARVCLSQSHNYKGPCLRGLRGLAAR
uniref:Knottins-like domain-containing protein n=1 Tax=Salix viminalis TaxID=40686 RepID=A0A6N2KAU0_SALVM